MRQRVFCRFIRGRGQTIEPLDELPNASTTNGDIERNKTCEYTFYFFSALSAACFEHKAVDCMRSFCAGLVVCKQSMQSGMRFMASCLCQAQFTLTMAPTQNSDLSRKPTCDRKRICGTDDHPARSSARGDSRTLT